MTMNSEAQQVFNKIIIKLNRGDKLSQQDILFLRARRSYLNKRQKFQYGDILYLNKQFFFQKVRMVIGLIGKFIKELIVALIVGLVLFWLGKNI